MAILSRVQERDERRKMGKGMTTSVVALILCWAPVLGVLLAAIGHIGVMRCITEKYKKRFIAYSILTAIILIVCVGVLTVEVYAYSRNPNIVADTGAWLLEVVTGESADGADLDDGYLYPYEDGFDENSGDDTFSQGYYDADGNFVHYTDDEGEGASGNGDTLDDGTLDEDGEVSGKG